DGFPDPDEKIRRVLSSRISDKIEAITPSIQILGLIQTKYNGRDMAPRAVHILGIDPRGRAQVGGFAEFLLDPDRRRNPSFEPTPATRMRHEGMGDFMPPGPIPF